MSNMRMERWLRRLNGCITSNLCVEAGFDWEYGKNRMGRGK